MNRAQIISYVGIFGLLLVVGWAAMARLVSDQTYQLPPQSTNLQDEAATDIQTEATELEATEDEACSTTTTENRIESDQNAVNESSTTVTCEVETEGNGSTDIRIENNTEQNATTGDSTGTSGSASNSNRTDINID